MANQHEERRAQRRVSSKGGLLGDIVMTLGLLVLAVLVEAAVLYALSGGVILEEPPPGGTDGEPVAATGVLEEPEATSYTYGTHAITDEVSGSRYALFSESVNLDAYIDELVAVYGTLVPGYENGLDGGPPLIEVSRVEPAGDPAKP